MRKPILLSLLLPWFAFSLGAQNPPAPPGQPARELRLLAWSPTAQKLEIGPSGQAQPLHLATNRFTTLSAIPPGATVQLFVTMLDANQKEQRLPYASAPWPGDSPAAIGILVQNGTPETPAGMLYLLPDDPAKHPEHSVRFLNLTSLRLALRAGGVNGDLDPRAELTVPFDPAQGRLRVDLAIPSGETWTRVLGTNLPVGRQHRLFALIRPPMNLEPGTTTNQPAITLVMDRTSAPGTRAALPVSSDPEAP